MKTIGGLGKASREQLGRVLRDSTGTVSPAQAARVLGIDARAASQLLARWCVQGWLARVRRGLYVPVPIESPTADIGIEDPWIIAEQLFSPCYIGGWSAAEYWGLTEQLFRSILVVTSRRPRARKVNARGAAFVIRTVSASAMFGLQPVWRGRVKVMVSDPARTVIDMLNAPALGGGIRTVTEVLRAYRASESWEPDLLIGYAGKLGSKTVFKRLGYLLSAYFPEERALIEQCRASLSTGNAKLDPKLPAVRMVTNWRLWVPDGYPGVSKT